MICLSHLQIIARATICAARPAEASLPPHPAWETCHAKGDSQPKRENAMRTFASFVLPIIFAASLSGLMFTATLA